MGTPRERMALSQRCAELTSMRSYFLSGLIGMASTMLAVGVLAANSPSKEDLSEYHSVKTARTREITPAPAGHGGQTGFLGVSVVRGKAGELLVELVQADSPAAKAGIRSGDVLTHVDGELLTSPEKLRDDLQTRGPTANVKLTFKRGEERLEAQVTLSATSRPRNLGPRGPYLGIAVDLSAEGEGVRVDQVAPESPAAAAGFKPGDQLLKIDSTELTRSSRLADILSEKKPGDNLAVAVRRGSEELLLHPHLAAEPTGPGTGVAGSGRRGDFARPALDLWKKPTFRFAIVPIEFPDIKHNSKISVKDWEQAFVGTQSARDKNSKQAGADLGSFNDYFREQSGGSFHVEGKVFEWIQVGKKRAEYAPGSGTTNITAVLVEALGKVTARDGKDAFKDCDGFLFLYAGSPVRSNRGSVYAPHAGIIRSFQSKRWPYLFAPEGGTQPTPMGIFVKEFYRVLGLPDLAARRENPDVEGLGVWCALANTFATNRPQHLSAWAKEKLGWIKPAVIDPTVVQKLVLSPIEESPQECFKILVRSDGSEYFLLENRARKGFDLNLPGEGLLIWRVVRDRPFLEESHGVLGPTGPTVHVDAIPYPSLANQSFTPQTTPSSRSPQGGGLPVFITQIRRLGDGRVTFVVGPEAY
jgi:M6 family metalloprotease-like protein